MNQRDATPPQKPEAPTPKTDALLAAWPSTLDTEGDALKMQSMVAHARWLERQLIAGSEIVASEIVEKLCALETSWNHFYDALPDVHPRAAEMADAVDDAFTAVKRLGLKNAAPQAVPLGAVSNNPFRLPVERFDTPAESASSSRPSLAAPGVAEALREAIDAGVRKPNEQFAYHRCNHCDCTWWGDVPARSNPERPVHRAECPIPKWSAALTSATPSPLAAPTIDPEILRLARSCPGNALAQELVRLSALSTHVPFTATQAQKQTDEFWARQSSTGQITYTGGILRDEAGNELSVADLVVAANLYRKMRDAIAVSATAPVKAPKFTTRERAMMRQALSLLLADEIQGERAGDREAAESAQAKL